MRRLLELVVKGAWVVRRQAANAGLALLFFGGLGSIAGAAFWIYPPAGLVVLGIEALALAVLIVAGEAKPKAPERKP